MLNTIPRERTVVLTGECKSSAYANIIPLKTSIGGGGYALEDGKDGTMEVQKDGKWWKDEMRRWWEDEVKRESGSKEVEMGLMVPHAK